MTILENVTYYMYTQLNKTGLLYALSQHVC